MRAADPEHRVLQIAERVKAVQPIEDTLVELKSQWPSPDRSTARKLAAHCNAARGEPVLWIIGLDEKRGVVGAASEELANWLPAVAKHFDGLAPDLIRDLNVPVQGKTLVSLLFSTERVPFVQDRQKRRRGA